MDWAQEHFSPDHAGVNPYERIISPSNVSTLVPRWVVHLPLFVYSTAVVGGVVYVGGGGESGPDKTHIYALDATDGHRLWHAVQRHGNVVHLAVGGGRVFVSTLSDHSIRAYDAATGALLWRIQMSVAPGKATLAGGRLFTQTTGGGLFSLDPTDGAILWQMWDMRDGSLLGPAVAGGVVYATDHFSVVRAYRASDGHFLWSVTVPDNVHNSATVVGGVLYVGAEDSGLCAVSLATHQPLWCGPTTIQTESVPTVTRHAAYLGDQGGNVYAFDPTTGDPLWSAALGFRFVLATPVVANGVVYAAPEGAFALRASTGEVLWSYPLGMVNADPIVVDGVLYVGDFDGNMYAFGLPAGQ